MIGPDPLAQVEQIERRAAHASVTACEARDRADAAGRAYAQAAVGDDADMLAFSERDRLRGRHEAERAEEQTAALAFEAQLARTEAAFARASRMLARVGT